jgi:hypothetical protein
MRDVEAFADIVHRLVRITALDRLPLLVIGGHPRVAVFHALLMTVIYAKEKGLPDQGPNFLA